MKIDVVGTVGTPAKYGGFETLVEYLTKHLASRHQMTVYCSSAAYAHKQQEHNGARLVYLPLEANGAQSIPYDVLSMLHAAFGKADVLLVLGVSGCVFLPVLKLFYRGRIVVNIDGLEWKRDKWGKIAKRFLKLSESLAVRYADVVVADNTVIADYVSSEYGKQAVMIPYGADHVYGLPVSPETLERFSFLSNPYAFKVCRIEPENNIHIILEAFAALPDQTLVIVGNWQNSPYGQSLRAKHSQHSHLRLLDPIYDQTVLNQLRSNCTLYVHGHSAGGTNPSLVEAMYLGLPILAYDVDYNRETTHHQAAYFSDTPSLQAAICSLGASDLSRIGEAMAAYAREHYTWQKVADAYAKLFEERLSA